MEKESDKILKLLTKIRKKYPSLRFCQIIGNCISGDIYFHSDKYLSKKLKELYEIKEDPS